MTEGAEVNPNTGFLCDCESRLDCYDGLIMHWSFDAAFEKAFRHWDWRVFTIAGWFLDECDGWDEPGEKKSVWRHAMENGGLRAALVIRLVQLRRLDFRR